MAPNQLTSSITFDALRNRAPALARNTLRATIIRCRLSGGDHDNDNDDYDYDAAAASAAAAAVGAAAAAIRTITRTAGRAAALHYERLHWRRQQRQRGVR